MEQCLRIALWMLLLVGYLQAAPATTAATTTTSSPVTCEMDKDDLGFTLLKKVSCENVTFTSPQNDEGQCHVAALEHYRKELKNAKKKCTDEEERIHQTLSALPKPSVKHTECNFTMTVHEKFESFVTAISDFAEQFNYHQGATHQPYRCFV